MIMLLKIFATSQISQSTGQTVQIGQPTGQTDQIGQPTGQTDQTDQTDTSTQNLTSIKGVIAEDQNKKNSQLENPEEKKKKEEEIQPLNTPANTNDKVEPESSLLKKLIAFFGGFTVITGGGALATSKKEEIVEKIHGKEEMLEAEKVTNELHDGASMADFDESY
jgi:hypothetical protein